MSYLFQCYAGLYDRFMRIFQLDQDSSILEMIGVGNKKIADIGGGTGKTAHKLVNYGHDLTIIDPSKPMTKRAIRRNPRIKVIPQSMPCKLDESYDIFLFRDCLHHIKEQKEVLKLCVHHLEKEGEIIIADFSPRSKRTKRIFFFERLLLEKIYPVEADKVVEELKSYNLHTETIHLNDRDYIVRGWKVN